MIKQRWKAILFITGVGVVAVLFLLLYLGERPLLDHASPVVEDTHRWIQAYGGYFWASDSEILSFREVGRGSVQAFRVYLAAGVSRPLVALNRRLHGTRQDTALWRLSPDGRWLVWLDALSGRPHWVASRLDGKRDVTWPVLGNSLGPLWLPGNARWVEFAYLGGQTALPWIHDLDGTARPGAKIQGPLRWPMGITPEARVLSLEMGRDDTVRGYLYGLIAPVAPPQTFAVSLPNGTQSVIEAELSPQGDRLAYILRSERQSPVQRFLQWLIPGVEAPTMVKYSLWESRVDGSRTHKVGDEEGHAVTGLLWTPGGRRVSFFCNNTLYTVPVD